MKRDRLNTSFCLFCLLFFLVVLGSCTFKPDENFVQLNREPTINLTDAALRNLDLMKMPDTFALFSRTTVLNYSIKFERSSTTVVTIYIDGKRIMGNQSRSGTFSISAADYADGFHSIRLAVVTNSGTGSLADQVGKEQLLWDLKWTFSIKRIQPPSLKITKVYPQNGRMVVEWEPSAVKTEKIIDFEYIFPYYPYPSNKWSYRIINPLQTKLIDTLTIEGKIKITLNNQSLDPVFTSPQDTKTVEYEIPKIVSYSSNENGTLTIKWNKSIFYNNVSKYSIDYPDGNRNQLYNIIFRSSNASDTTATFNRFAFGSIANLFFRTTARYSYFPASTAGYRDTIVTRSLASINVGEKLNQQFDFIVHSPLNTRAGFGVSYDSKKFYVLNGDQVILTVPMPQAIFLRPEQVATSNNGEYMYYSYGSQIKRLDRLGNIELVLDTKGTVYNKTMLLSGISIGANRYLCFSDRGDASYKIHTYMYDIVSNQPVFDFIDPQVNYNLRDRNRQSPDGKYLVLHNGSKVNLYTLSGGKIQSSKDFTNLTSLGFFTGSFFSTTLGNKVILCNREELILYDPTSDQSVTKKISGGGILFINDVNYDPATEKIGYYGADEYYYVIDVSKAEVIRKILVISNVRPYSLYNGNLYLSWYRLNLKLN